MLFDFLPFTLGMVCNDVGLVRTLNTDIESGFKKTILKKAQKHLYDKYCTQP